MLLTKENPMWKNKPIAIFHNELNNDVLIERLERSFQIHYSESLVPFSCYFPTSQATFLLIDFKCYFQHWTEDEAYDEEKINWLTKFVNTNDGPHFIYLCPQVDELLISVTYDIQRSIETMVMNKTVLFGFAPSWKAAANYMKEAANKFSVESVAEYSAVYQKDIEFLIENAKRACTDDEADMSKRLQVFSL
ncbi:uncharacterized protein LOC124344229 [Daphnia pulicaria]|uniref:uncharacterized protein LOC124344229 n=1 Tax=Daphnia pulicaria TaxID=35523 RepID=UPI001EE9D590|nr:uncharacterized protein LOC124344229 [Daphnia pulicaria]